MAEKSEYPFLKSGNLEVYRPDNYIPLANALKTGIVLTGKEVTDYLEEAGYKQKDPNQTLESFKTYVNTGRFFRSTQVMLYFEKRDSDEGRKLVFYDWSFRLEHPDEFAQNLSNALMRKDARRH